jgi:geranylgeranyl diphosphate synthase type I
MTSSPAALGQVREQVGRALAGFLVRQRAVLAGIDEDLLPGLDAVSDLVAGGKRLRPAFCYWGWRAAGDGGDPHGPGRLIGSAGPDGSGSSDAKVFAAAAALELLHASALVHDDVMDRSDVRRGQPALHRRFAGQHAAAGWHGSAESFGAGVAILLGDLLLAWTGELFRASGLPAAALRRGQPILDAMCTEVIAGQYLDLLGQAAGPGTVDGALRVVRYKSAKYTVERPLQLGAALAAAPAGAARTVTGASGHSAVTEDPVAAACTAYGLPLGVAFQLRDDVLGVFGDPAETGKPVTGDLREGKRTVLVAIASSRASTGQAGVLRRHLGDPRLDDAAAAEVRAVLTETGALAECEQTISSSVRQALAALTEAPFTEDAKKALAELAVTATDRAG